MDTQVAQEFDKIEQQRKEVLADAGKLSEAQQTFKPTPDSWCILEVFDHLMTSERNGLRYSSKKVLGDPKTFQNKGLVSKLRLILLKVSLGLPIKFKAPPAAEIKPRDNYDYAEIKGEWDALRGDWKDFLEKLDEQNLNKLIFMHAVAGRMSITEGLAFFYEHVDHHKKQIERIKAHPDYPKA